jgi:hypothetical protein
MVMWEHDESHLIFFGGPGNCPVPKHRTLELVFTNKQLFKASYFSPFVQSKILQTKRFVPPPLALI